MKYETTRKSVLVSLSVSQRESELLQLQLQPSPSHAQSLIEWLSLLSNETCGLILY